MITISYRLDEYKIVESDSGDLTWETHGGFGAIQKGRCFRKGSLLFIGPAETDEPGFLKREFLEHLKTLPAWSKTRQSCKGFEIYRCMTQKPVTKPEMMLWILEPSDHEAGSLRENTEAVYRLLRYELIMKPTGEIFWKTPTGPTAISCGTCIILEDILFIGPKQSTENSVSTRGFFPDLKRRPKWDQTTYYSTNIPLRTCSPETGEPKEQKRRIVKRRMMDKPLSEKPIKRHPDVKVTDSTLWVASMLLISSGIKKSKRCINNLLIRYLLFKR